MGCLFGQPEEFIRPVVIYEDTPGREMFVRGSVKYAKLDIANSMVKNAQLAALPSLIRGCGGIGRHARLRGVWLTPCEFESRYPHSAYAFRLQDFHSQVVGFTPSFCSKLAQKQQYQGRSHESIGYIRTPII